MAERLGQLTDTLGTRVRNRPHTIPNIPNTTIHPNKLIDDNASALLGFGSIPDVLASPKINKFNSIKQRCPFSLFSRWSEMFLFLLWLIHLFLLLNYKKQPCLPTVFVLSGTSYHNPLTSTPSLTLEMVIPHPLFNSTSPESST